MFKRPPDDYISVIAVVLSAYASMTTKCQCCSQFNLCATRCAFECQSKKGAIVNQNEIPASQQPFRSTRRYPCMPAREISLSICKPWNECEYILRAIWQIRSWLWVIDTKQGIYVPLFEYSTVLSLCSYALIVLAYCISDGHEAQPMHTRDFGLPKINNNRQ